MILIVTNKHDFTADYVILELHSRGIDFVRFNTEDFPFQTRIEIHLSGKGFEGGFHFSNTYIDFTQITSVWYRRPVASTIPSEIEDKAAQSFIKVESKETLDSLWRMNQWYWISSPDNIRQAESKLYQLKVAVDLGFTIPTTLVTTLPEQGHTFFERHNQSVICKTQRQSYIPRDEDIGLIYTNHLTHEDARHFDQLRVCPTLLQPYVDKAQELRVTVVGTHIFAVALDSQAVPDAMYDWRRTQVQSIHHTPYHLNESLAKKCIMLVQHLGLQFGAIDLILSHDGSITFLEINPNGQWAWIQQMCPELDIRSALIDLLLQSPHV